MFKRQKAARVLPYDPGVLPTRRALPRGKSLRFGARGLPPWRDAQMSLLRPDHPAHMDFLTLRDIATKAMHRHAWTDRPLDIAVRIYAPRLPEGRSTLDFSLGIAEALCGSAEKRYTYLPIVMQHRGQIRNVTLVHRQARLCRYDVKITFR